MTLHPLEQKFMRVKYRRPGLTYDAFGKYFGLSGSMIHAIEKGRTGLGRDTLAVIRVMFPTWQPLIDNYLVETGMKILGKPIKEGISQAIDQTITDKHDNID